LKREEKVNKANKFYRRIAPALVFGTPQVQQLEYKGAQILRSLFQLFRSEYFSVTNADRKPHLLPRDLEERIFNLPCAAKDERARLICDHLAGMSDDFAIRTYRRIFEADYGSIVDLV
jgi:dGTPase